MTKIILKLGQTIIPPQTAQAPEQLSDSESKLQDKQLSEEEVEPSLPKPSGISIRIQKGNDFQSDEESKVGCSDMNSLILGKRAVRKWEKRWVLQQNVFDLNQGDIWVQKWIRAEKAEEDQAKLNKIKLEIEKEEEAIRQQQILEAASKSNANLITKNQVMIEDQNGVKIKADETTISSVARLIEISQGSRILDSNPAMISTKDDGSNLAGQGQTQFQPIKESLIQQFDPKIVQLQNNDNLVLQSQIPSQSDREDDNIMREFIRKKQLELGGDQFGIDRVNFAGLSPEQIRELMAVCDDSFDHENYSDEMEDDGVAKEYICQIEECLKVFTDLITYRKHLVTHGERLYRCTQEGCGKKFLDNSKLKRHQLVHTGEKPYKCDICGKCFSLDFNLRTHLRTHTGEKPYVCSFQDCNKRFTQSSNLTAHEKTHTQRDSMENQEETDNGAFYDADMPRRGRKPKPAENIFIVEYCGPAKNRNVQRENID